MSTVIISNDQFFFLDLRLKCIVKTLDSFVATCSKAACSPVLNTKSNSILNSQSLEVS